ncbi:MAG: hypothetical protein AAGD00_06765 [Planctomycetota bacterium]
MTPTQRKAHVIAWIVIGPVCLMILVVAIVSAAFNRAALAPGSLDRAPQRSVP